MWFIQPKQDYIAQMPWKHAEETMVMSWQIRARNYDTFAANILLAVLAVIYCIGAYVFSSLFGETLTFTLLVGGCFY